MYNIIPKHSNLTRTITQYLHEFEKLVNWLHSQSLCLHFVQYTYLYHMENYTYTTR